MSGLFHVMLFLRWKAGARHQILLKEVQEVYLCPTTADGSG
jgi:hypothetical protein